MIKLGPDTAPQMAEEAAGFVKSKFGVTLSYSPESLELINLVVDKVKESGATEQQAAGLLLSLGCYVGEVFVRHAKASWRPTAQLGMTAVCSFPMALEISGLRGVNPIGKVFKRFSGGTTEDLPFFYQTTVRLVDAEQAK